MCMHRGECVEYAFHECVHSAVECVCCIMYANPYANCVSVCLALNITKRNRATTTRQDVLAGYVDYALTTLLVANCLPVLDRCLPYSTTQQIIYTSWRGFMKATRNARQNGGMFAKQMICMARAKV